ncbi:hypothetical protein WKV44_07970 [Spirochaetia bacterium 38H-sp]|uniref:ABC transporter permease n=1 Tax=Rarispira pelagica TaxID=3141764 RepID=A0ABU9UCT7_9SPIR
MMGSIFSPARFFYFSLRDFVFNKKNYILLAAITFGITVVISFFSQYFSSNIVSADNSNGSFFSTYLFFSTLGVAASSFDYYKKNSLMNDAFMLPASFFEKWLFAFVKTLILWPIVFIAVVFLGFFIGEFLGSLVFSASFSPFPSFVHSIGPVFSGDYMLGFISSHAIFFFGAVFFRKNAFFKTLLSIICFFVIFVLWLILWAYVFAFSSSMVFDVFSRMYLSWDVIRMIYIFVIVFFWGMSFIRFRELENINGF